MSSLRYVSSCTALGGFPGSASQDPLKVFTSSLSRPSMVIVTANITGPMNKPRKPNTLTPPNTAKKISRVCICTLPLIKYGRSTLSIVPTTNIPQTASTIAFIQLPVTSRYSAAGSQTAAVPTSGSSAKNDPTTPQRKDDGTPKTHTASPTNETVTHS